MELRILDTNFIDVDVIDSYDSLVWTERYYSCGDMEIYTGITKHNLEVFREDFYLISNDSEKTMIIEDIQILTEVEEGNTLAITGRSLESILERRIIWNQTVLEGNFQNGIKQLLDENVINPEDPSRRIENFIFKETDNEQIQELTIEGQFRGENLYETICSLCEVNKIGFKITLTSDNHFAFELYSGEDRSYDQVKNPYVIFSPDFDNLISSNYLESKKVQKTAVLVGGEGEGDKKKTVTVVDENGGGTGLDRREMYSNASDLSTSINGFLISNKKYLAQLEQRGKEELANNTFFKSFEGEVEPNVSFRYGEDYFMGDIVQLTNEYGMETKSRVTEFIRSINSSGIDVYPTFSAVE